MENQGWWDEDKEKSLRDDERRSVLKALDKVKSIQRLILEILANQCHIGAFFQNLLKRSFFGIKNCLFKK